MTDTKSSRPGGIYAGPPASGGTKSAVLPDNDDKTSEPKTTVASSEVAPQGGTKKEREAQRKAEMKEARAAASEIRKAKRASDAEARAKARAAAAATDEPEEGKVTANDDNEPLLEALGNLTDEIEELKETIEAANEQSSGPSPLKTSVDKLAVVMQGVLDALKIDGKERQEQMQAMLALTDALNRSNAAGGSQGQASSAAQPPADPVYNLDFAEIAAKGWGKDFKIGSHNVHATLVSQAILALDSDASTESLTDEQKRQIAAGAVVMDYVDTFKKPGDDLPKLVKTASTVLSAIGESKTLGSTDQNNPDPRVEFFVQEGMK